MEIIKLEILNLASLDKSDGEVINFKEGALGDSNIFCIVGPTGSGKSTLLDAICLALYNRAPRYPRKNGEKQSIKIYSDKNDAEKTDSPLPTAATFSPGARSTATASSHSWQTTVCFTEPNGTSRSR